jgi:hypothetical protein
VKEDVTEIKAAGRYKEILELLALAPYKFWYDRLWGISTLRQIDFFQKTSIQSERYQNVSQQFAKRIALIASS